MTVVSLGRGRLSILAVLSAVAVCVTALLPIPVAQADNRLGDRGHWDRTSSVAHVKFLDHTGPSWPIGTSSSDWDEAPSIDVDWETADDSSTCGVDCVQVVSRNPAEDPQMGANCSGAAAY